MAPYLKIGIHGTPFGEVTWNHTPLATTFENVQHTTKHLIKINGSRTCLATCLLEHKLDSAKLFTTDVAWIVFARHDEILGKYTAYLRLTNPNLDYEQALKLLHHYGDTMPVVMKGFWLRAVLLWSNQCASTPINF
jgi:hypothetical protein